MDLDRKIGRLFVVPARGDVIRHVRENHVGGVIWFESTAAEAKAVNAHLQRIASWPLLISADLDELIGLSDTLRVMYRGRLVADADPATITPEELGSAMTGAGLDGADAHTEGGSGAEGGADRRPARR